MVSPNSAALARGAKLLAAARANSNASNPEPRADLLFFAQSMASGCTRLQGLIQQKCEELSAPWTGTIIFPVYPANAKHDDLVELFSKPPERLDICTYLKGGRDHEGNNRLYFCPTTYPPPAEGDSKEESEKKFKKLDQDLKRAASSSGSPIVVARGRTKDRGCEHNYQCDHSYSKHKSRATKTDIPYRTTSLISNDMNGRRTEFGKSGSKRTNVTDRTSHCPFNFVLKSDSHGFFITLFRQAGNPTHEGHPKYDLRMIPEKSSLLTEDEIDTVKHVMDSCRSVAAGRNFMKSKYNMYLTYAKMAYIDTLGKASAGDEYESLISMLENSEECIYNILWSCKSDDTGGDDIAVISSTKIDGDDEDHQITVDINDVPELAPVAAEARQERQDQAIPEDRTIFHAISWANEKVFRYFKLNPEAITCDVTSHTNRSGFHLLTFSTKTAIDKQVVFLRIWIPNQKRVSFRYVFQEALTKLIPSYIRDRVMFIMKDGDPQQGKEILLAIKMHFQNAIEGGCGFHIVNMGWDRHVQGWKCVPDEHLDEWKRVKKGIHKWMYSWMRPGYCENEEEYKISKHLLLQFVSSAYVRRLTGGNETLIKKIIDFIRNHVFVYEDLYLHHRRRDVRNFEVSHSSAHEGTNFGLKSHAAAVQPTMGMDNAAGAMGIQDDMKGGECDYIVYRDFRNSNKTWSSRPTAPYLTSFGEGVLLEAYHRSELYRARRTGVSTFQVVYIGPGHDPSFASIYVEGLDLLGCEVEASAGASVSVSGSTAAPGLVDVKDDDETTTTCLKNGDGDADDLDISDCALPLFSRAHVVTLGSDSTCSCCRFQRTGLPCSHIICCANQVCAAGGTKFAGFDHNSISVRWWSSFMYYAYKAPGSESEKELVQLFHALAMNDRKGPSFDLPIPNTMKVYTPIPDMPPVDRLKNYDKSLVPSLDQFDGLFTSTHQPNANQANEEELLSNDSVLSKLLSLSSAETEAVFESSVSNVVGAHRPGVGIRKALYPLWNEVTDVHKSLKDEAMDKELEEMLKRHLAKCRGLMRDSGRGKKRRGSVEPITSEKYEGTAKRVYNTKSNGYEC